MNILDRYRKPTPKFFRILRNLGVGLATAGCTILAAPMEIPTFIISMAAYILVAGMVASAVSQAAVEDNEKQQPPKTEDHGN